MAQHEHICVSIVPLFNHLDFEDQKRIKDLVITKHYDKGEVVFSPDSDDQLTIVARGSMKIYRLGENGKERLLRMAKPGDYDGEASLFGVTNDNMFGEAMEKTEVCFVRQSDFQDLLKNYPDLSLKLLTMNAQKSAQTELQTQLLWMERIEQRVAFYLSNLSYELDEEKFELPMKMKDLANYLGTSPETLSRELKSLENNKIIARERRVIEILDMDRLEDVIES